MEILNLDHSLFIKGYHISTELCDEILNAQEGRNKLLYRQSFGKRIKGYDLILLDQLSESLHGRYITELEKCKLEYIEQYPILKNISNITLEHQNNIPTVHVQRYTKGKSYNVLHCENDANPLFLNRILVFMTYLNDIHEDGETYFPYQNFTCKPKKGLTLIWPAYFTHVHKGIPAHKEIKYILTGWFRVYDNSIVPSS